MKLESLLGTLLGDCPIAELVFAIGQTVLIAIVEVVALDVRSLLRFMPHGRMKQLDEEDRPL